MINAQKMAEDTKNDCTACNEYQKHKAGKTCPKHIEEHDCEDHLEEVTLGEHDQTYHAYMCTVCEEIFEYEPDYDSMNDELEVQKYLDQHEPTK